MLGWDFGESFRILYSFFSNTNFLPSPMLIIASSSSRSLYHLFVTQTESMFSTLVTFSSSENNKGRTARRASPVLSRSSTWSSALWAMVMPPEWCMRREQRMRHSTRRSAPHKSQANVSCACRPAWLLVLYIARIISLWDQLRNDKSFRFNKGRQPHSLA